MCVVNTRVSLSIFFFLCGYFVLFSLPNTEWSTEFFYLLPSCNVFLVIKLACINNNNKYTLLLRKSLIFKFKLNYLLTKKKLKYLIVKLRFSLSRLSLIRISYELFILGEAVGISVYVSLLFILGEAVGISVIYEL